MKRDALIDRLSKIKTLSEKGVGGEKSAAERLLNDQLRKNNMTIDDLDASRITEMSVSCKCVFERKLLIQIVAIVCRKLDACSVSGRSVIFRCTPAEWIEISAMFEFFRGKLAEDLNNVFHAFLDVNDLFPALKNDDPTPEKFDAEQVDALSNALKKHEFREKRKRLKKIM